MGEEKKKKCLAREVPVASRARADVVFVSLCTLVNSL